MRCDLSSAKAVYEEQATNVYYNKKDEKNDASEANPARCPYLAEHRLTVLAGQSRADA